MNYEGKISMMIDMPVTICYVIP